MVGVAQSGAKAPTANPTAFEITKGAGTMGEAKFGTAPKLPLVIYRTTELGREEELKVTDIVLL